MKKSVFLIVGCQRSGTTLLESILDAHPLVRVVGEENWDAYRYFASPELLNDFVEPYIGLRIPAATQRVEHAVKALPTARVIFIMRNLFDVVTSMRKLQMLDGYSGRRGSWLECYGQGEIKNCLAHLPPYEPLAEKYRKLRECTDEDNDVRFGGICWGLKNRFLQHYEESPLHTTVVKYETLTASPEASLRQLCYFLQLEWHGNLMQHQKFSSGIWAGTDKSKPIHTQSVSMYGKHLTPHEQRALSYLFEPDNQ